MLRKNLLCEYDKKSIISFLNDYLNDVSMEDNKTFVDGIRRGITGCEINEREMQGYYCYINYLQGIVWQGENGEWIFAVTSERALRELIRMVSENEKRNFVFEKNTKT